MLEVQSVISRTYGIAHLSRHAKDGYDVCATTHCQLFQPGRLKTSRWAPLADQAARRTTGQVLWFDAGPATALFHSDCGGHTSRATDVWGGTGAPYLSGVVDDGPAKRVHTEWRYEATADALQRALNGDARTRIGTLTGIRVAERDDAGRAGRITLVAAQPRTVRGEEFRDVLTRAFGAQAIKSTWFDVRRERDGYVFEGRGFGHGVGLCQTGALARIAAGASVASVLARYYPGVTLATMSRAGAPRASAISPSSRTPRY
jgi:stage II sporulation protein D